jgi:hypothetical protein
MDNRVRAAAAQNDANTLRAAAKIADRMGCPALANSVNTLAETRMREYRFLSNTTSKPVFEKGK